MENIHRERLRWMDPSPSDSAAIDHTHVSESLWRQSVGWNLFLTVQTTR